MSITRGVDSTTISEISIAFSFPFVFWIDASSISTITQGLKGICNLPAAQSSGLDGSPESALHWIGSLKENYIMVFDNADVLSPAELEAYLPPGRGGNIRGAHSSVFRPFLSCLSIHFSFVFTAI